MINKKTIQDDQALQAVQKGEFDTSILASAPAVAVILTQDWCPQWQDMKRWVYDIQCDIDTDVYELEYNKADYFPEFKSFKEDKLGNDNIPYLRFYKDGVFVKDTNYISQNEFSDILKGLK
jgi:hypothetical protein